MKTSDFDFPYPESLIATDPGEASRVVFCEGENPPVELSISNLLDKILPNDLVVINDTKVVKKRIFATSGLEILFLDEVEKNHWAVLMPSKKLKLGDVIELPGGVLVTLIEKGLPQKIKTSESLDFKYFESFGHMALPPYIQKARGKRKSVNQDDQWYQTAWAEKQGSSAAPTASLHFSNDDWEKLKHRNINVETLTLHVGLGTFLPVHTENLTDHKMHSERVEIPQSTIKAIEETKNRKGRVWALGTTVTRALESLTGDYYSEKDGHLIGDTDIFIYPGFEFQVVDVLMTNFHQPKSTLLALVAAFTGREKTLHTYQWAIEKGFRLFSYGDLSVWTRS